MGNVKRARCGRPSGRSVIWGPLCIFFGDELNVLGVDLALCCEILQTVAKGSRIDTSANQNAETHLWVMFKGAFCSFATKFEHDYASKPCFVIPWASFL
ncbi:hypothetical protein SARC_07934 [Sphaeroforma arctica JP610]|uniref:Uncharacterized protein n=1 Tax=Sphaeroforma arctica JP610 TaxID=667725 RepID=A0A0L0FSF3_9EUKA|nr:hypothetical protein SARC_07934 [Sphaeroforma arctica JP610]KNC79670.1 hypothetical protein SARC_07934 [Sphaeroforma arctica JP610]|eukprot:XP_014153572.1 hypothetical protein SARC_07934 [Sphaeroforma arctica JP610]